MNQRSYPHVVSNRTDNIVRDQQPRDIHPIAARRLSDKASLLRPLQDEHLLEVYREAKKLNLSAEFIELLEDAISMRNLKNFQEA